MNENINIVKELKKILIEHFDNDIKDVILFGSRATGSASKYSDYDVLVILKQDYDWHYRNEILRVVYKLELKKDIMIDIHLLSTNEVSNTLRGSQPVFINALNTGLYA
ncbi:nucleotidyltransferase domain-containing protein [bacterium]|nr:nucleotidyltransferase domain-containing protein [bacterium]